MDTQEANVARYEAEKALLGSILIDPDIISQVKLRVLPEDFVDSAFYKGKHTRLFRAMLLCPHPDQISVARKLFETNKLEKGDVAYLSHLISVSPTCVDWPEYCQAVVTYSGRKPQKELRGIEI